MSAPAAVSSPALHLNAVSSGYGRTMVLHDVSLTVPAGGIVALLGPNGAGKSTLLRTCSGLLKPRSGAVLVNGEDVSRLEPFQRLRKGLCHVPEGRGIFQTLTVADNLRLSAPPWVKRPDVAGALEAFPVLGRRMNQLAGSLSGGEQQMLALARSYMCNPSVVLLDEVSMGLAPLVVDRIYENIKALTATGAALLLVEQYVQRVLALAEFAYILNHGVVRFAGDTKRLQSDAIMQEYLGAQGSTSLAVARPEGTSRPSADA